MGDLMILRQACVFVGIATFIALISMPRSAAAIAVSGTVEPAIPSGQFIAMKMTVDDTTTTFELTGPDFSWFALGFTEEMTMKGYAFIVEGTDATRTVVEQNIMAVGDPGSPQSTQNISILNTIHDSANHLTTVILERANDTGDTNDPVFSPITTSFAIMGAYDSFSSSAAPNGVLTYHGRNGRGFGTITLVPEPGGVVLASLAVASMLFASKRRRP
jgi:hypothetical protein